MRPLASLVACVLAITGLADASHDNGTGPRSLGGVTLPQQEPALLRLEAETFDDLSLGAPLADAGATGGEAWTMPAYGRISFHADVPTDGIAWLLVRARGEHPPGMLTTHMHPVVDDAQRGEWDVGPNWTTFRQALPLTAGRHVFGIDNFNNYHAPVADRTLVVDWVELSVPFLEGAPHVDASVSVFVDGPLVHEAGTGMARIMDPEAHNQTSWQMWGIGCFAEMIVADGDARYPFTARLRGDAPDGIGSNTTVFLDGKPLTTVGVGAAWQDVATTLPMARGPHILTICYDNDYGGAQKRNLWLDELRIAAASPAASAAPPSTPISFNATPIPVATPPTVSAPPAASPTSSPPLASPPVLNSSASSSQPVPAAGWLGLGALALASLVARRR